MVVTYPEIRLVGLTLGVDGQRIDDVVRHADDGWQARIHSDGQPLYGGTLDTVAWAETGTEAWSNL
jgi:hypothetical protein